MKSYLMTYEKTQMRIVKVNDFLEGFDITPINKKEYRNPTLKEILIRCRHSGDYNTALSLLSVLNRDKDSRELSVAYCKEHMRKNSISM